jgi:DNA-binding response OmpR family regulator
VVIEVEDNGQGMSPEQAAHAFDRFYSGATSFDMGTGLGLSLSKELIALHGGSISLKSEKNTGTTFYVTLPLGNTHFAEDERTETTAQPGNFMHDTLGLDDIELAEEAAEESLPASKTSVLIVEDNRELSLYLRTSLSKSFQVLTAFDGAQGLELAIQHVPDIIVCDVMIPEKDGLTVTRSLKTDSRTSHIPIILLTAKSEDEHQIKGIKAGADVYITKPFNFEYLAENINNLLHNRAMLKSHYLGVAFGDEESQEHAMTAKDPDKEFVQRFKALVQDKLHDAEFNVNEICREMGFSRVQLYRKVHALLDSPVNDYINTLRLRRAMKMLKTSTMNVSDIAYACGFSSPTYFSTAFKNYYKLPPSEVRKG